MSKKPDPSQEPQIGTGYPTFQLAKALLTSEQHQDAAARQRAEGKIAKWLKVIYGMLSGTIEVGSRKPIKNVPIWATPEVVTGGFATGSLLAGGPLREHEYQWLAEIPVTVASADVRRALNAYFVSDEGLRKLQDRLDTGRYDVDIPEEGALLAIAWLARHGHADAARTVLCEISKHFADLRFYPVPAEKPLKTGTRVHLESVGAVAKRFAAIKPNRSILAQKETIQKWLPMYDRMVALFFETVQGEIPSVSTDEAGKPKPPQNGKFSVEGGWPCQTYPAGWTDRAAALLEEYARHFRQHTDSNKPRHRKSRLVELHALLERCVADPRSFTGRDVGRIRLILAGFIAKRGTPGSPECDDRRKRQIAQAEKPTFFDVGRAIAPRLAAHPQDEGIENLADVTLPITPAEAEVLRIPAGTGIPATMLRKLERCQSDTIARLVERNVITSGEILARVLPQTTSNIRAAAFADAGLRTLYAAVYRAFRRRRSLLLLHLQSQVKIEELPWIAALEPFRVDDGSNKEAARRCLRDVAALTLRAFPQAIVPNKLLREWRALSKEAGLGIPFVDELAADIFMGQFSGNFVSAAKAAASLLEGSLYQRYYDIDWREIQALPEPTEESGKAGRRWTSADKLLRICETRAGIAFGGYKPAENGMIIEQQQILTTQNLAALFAGLPMKEDLQDHLTGMAQQCFRWICRRQQAKASKWHARLIMVKNTAYAWRQLMFYLSMMPSAPVEELVLWAHQHLTEQAEEFRHRFTFVLRGLELALSNVSLDSPEAQQQGVRRFLGWSRDKHWLLA